MSGNRTGGGKWDNDLNSWPKSTGKRTRYHALWHLKVLGVVDCLQPLESSHWDAVSHSLEGDGKKKQVKVAVIDTLPAFTHPNLAQAIHFDQMLDFTSDIEGKKVEKSKQSPFGFGAHGTSVAGLIAARPRDGIKLRIPPVVRVDPYFGVEASSEIPVDLPFCGINPFARIIPIVVSASPDPEMILAAITYAKKIKPDVVVIADSWDRGGSAYQGEAQIAERFSDPSIPTDYGSTVPSPVNQTTKPATDLWKEVENALLDLCMASFVFCAAGNEPRSNLVYPARLSTAKSGPWTVGACDVSGKDLTYTPPSDEIRMKPEGHRLITTLSSEHPRFDEDVQMLDPFASVDEELDLPEKLFEKDFQPADIVTTDVPGPAGYNPSPFHYFPAEKKNGSKHLEIASLYCRFSGTSAATAIAAGLVSLAIALLRKDGKEPGQATGTGPYTGPAADTAELFNLERARMLVKDGWPTRFRSEQEPANDMAAATDGT